MYCSYVRVDWTTCSTVTSALRLCLKEESKLNRLCFHSFHTFFRVTPRYSVFNHYPHLLRTLFHILSTSFDSTALQDIQKTNRHVRTPDCALITPVEVHGHLCHWVESKASFGDVPTMLDNEREQFHG